MLVRRTSFERIGPFDATLLAASFFDWLGRAKTAGFKSLMLPDVVHRRRLHLTNYGRVNTVVRDERLLLALRRQIARRREPG